MNFVDMHADTLMQIYEKKANGEEISFEKNDLMIDFARMRKSGYKGQIFACFLDLEKDPIKESHYEDALAMIDLLETALSENSDVINKAVDRKTYYENSEKNLINAFLSVEEGGIIGEDLKKLEELKKRGISVVTLTWNYENSIGFPNIGFKYQNDGLKPFGFEVLEKMNELNMAVDVSHLSDAGFWDVVKYNKRPFLASHSDCRAIQNHPRNLTDEMIRALSKNGGLAGLNFSKNFILNGYSSLDGMIMHIKHFIDVGGEEIVALGSDFDGIERVNLEIEGAEDLYKLYDRLKKEKFSERVIDGICYKNFEKFMDRFEESK